MLNKIRYIFLPFVLLVIGFGMLYTLLNWLLVVKWGVVNIREDVVNTWLPLGLPVIIVFIWLWPRIKLLKLKTSRNDGATFYFIIAALAIGAPAAIAQHYMVASTGKLTKLNDISQIATQPATRYYSLDKYAIDSFHRGVKYTSEVSGRHNESLYMYMYIVSPLMRSDGDTSSRIHAWIGYHYHLSMSNRLSDSEKEAKARAFAQESWYQYPKDIAQRFTYLERLGNTDERPAMEAAIQETKLQDSTIAPVILLPVYEPFSSRTGTLASWMFITLGIGMAAWLLMTLIPGVHDDRLARLQNGETSAISSIGDEGLRSLLPNRDFYITPILIAMNIGVFLIMVFMGLGFMSFSSEDLLHWGANYKPVTTSGQWWRLLTSTFLHGGLMHLAMNMYGLLFVGVYLEPKLGRLRFLAAYLITGIIASVASITWHSATVSIGASGAIFGMYGVFLAYLTTHRFTKGVRNSMLAYTSVFVGYNLILGFADTGIDNAAHLGGLISGIITGYILHFTSDNPVQENTPEEEAIEAEQ